MGLTAEGDAAKARPLLEAAGKLGQKVVYAYAISNTQEQEAVVIAAALKAAGFEVVTKAISEKTYFDEIGLLDNRFDLYQVGFLQRGCGQ